MSRILFGDFSVLYPDMKICVFGFKMIIYDIKNKNNFFYFINLIKCGDEYIFVKSKESGWICLILGVWLCDDILTGIF